MVFTPSTEALRFLKNGWRKAALKKGLLNVARLSNGFQRMDEIKFVALECGRTIQLYLTKRKKVSSIELNNYFVIVF
jgi:hypothetical protein